MRIRGLKLVGPNRSYQVLFTSSPDGATKELAVIAGEISTGKTTVLEFIDWCLGAKTHPEHDEIIANVRSAQLAIEVQPPTPSDGSPTEPMRYVIERALGGESTKAWLYSGDHDSMSRSPLRSLESNPADDNSISQYLLQLCGLGGLRLRAAPTQEESKTSVLSFRDVQPVWYLSNRRMDNASLALEHNFARSIKLVQIVNLFFGVSDGQSSALGQRVDELASEERELRRAFLILRTFLADAGFDSLDSLDQKTDAVRVNAVARHQALKGIDERLAAATNFADDLRLAYRVASERTQELENELRDRETLAKRLDPLRSQYADELRKLELVDESVGLFDSLLLVTCPACLRVLETTPTLDEGTCSLCHSQSQSDGDEAGVREPPIDLAVERRSLKRRLNQLKQYSQEVRVEAEKVRDGLVVSQAETERAQRDLDFATRDALSPFIAERDLLSQEAGSYRAELKSLEGSRAMMKQLQQKETELRQVEAALIVAKERKRTHAQTQSSSDIVLSRLGTRMEAILRDFGYPKVDQVWLDKKLIPYVRGRRYDTVGSSGAMTLIAVAWQLSIFELAVEEGGGHPGFLLIDSPQKNLRAGRIVEAADNDKVLAGEIVRNRANIVKNIYSHIERWLSANPGAQIIIVDNEPPESIDYAEVVRFSGDPNDPPYGLIDNEDGSEGTTRPPSLDE